MFRKYSDLAKKILVAADKLGRRLRSEALEPCHILYALADCTSGVACQAIKMSGLRVSELVKLLEHEANSNSKLDVAAGMTTEPDICYDQPALLEEIKLGEATKTVLRRAQDIRQYFGHKRLDSEHLLLSILDSHDKKTDNLLEELGVNLEHLQTVSMQLVCRRDCFCPDAPQIRSVIIEGLSELIGEKADTVHSLELLARKAGMPRLALPKRPAIAHLIVVSYLPEFLFVQVAYQRYLLEESLKLFQKRSGTLDQEHMAGAISISVQHFRKEVRTAIEYIWSNELLLSSRLPDEADYDLIGSVIEDLWWTHSEAIALQEVFGEALDDYRRKQMLNLQKRRLEIVQRLLKLKARLNETVLQCVQNKSMSA